MGTPMTPPTTWIRTDPASATVVLLPAMGVRATYYGRFAEQLAGQGFEVLLADLRGQGEFGPPPSRTIDHGFAELVQDAAAIVGEASAAGRAVVLVGHSLGGHIAQLYAAAGDVPPIAGIVTIAADSPYYRAFGARGPLVLANAQLGAAVARVLGWLPGDKPGFGGLGAQPRTLMAQWAKLGRSGRYEVPELDDVETKLSSAKVPALAVSIEGDPIAPEASVEHLAGKLDPAVVQRLHYTREQAGGRLDHVTWARSGEALAVAIGEWWSRVRPG